MAQASEELGNATILGGSINPLQVFMGQAAARERQKAEQAALATKQRDKLIDDLDKHSPDKVWDPFYGEINQITNQHVRDYTRQAIDAGVPIPKIQQELNRRWGDVNTEVSRANMHKESYHAAKDQLKQYGDLYKPEATTALNNIFFDGPNARKIHDINVDNIAPQVFDNPDLMNKKAVAIKFMKDLPEKVNQYYTAMFNPLGQQYNIQDTKTKLGIQQDDQGRIVMDPNTGMPKINMTDDVYIQAMQDPMLSKIVQKEVPNGTIAQNKAYLTALLEGYDPKEIKNRPQLGFKTPADENPKFSKWGINFGHKVDDLEARRDIVEKMASGTRPDVLAAIGNVVKGSSAQYVDGGKKIRVTYKANLADPNFDPNDLTKLKDAYIKNTYNKGKNEVTSDIDISTPEAKDRAQYALSEILDSQNAKTSIGADRFHRYKEAHAKNNPKSALKTIPGF